MISLMICTSGSSQDSKVNYCTFFSLLKTFTFTLIMYVCGTGTVGVYIYTTMVYNIYIIHTYIHVCLGLHVCTCTNRTHTHVHDIHEAHVHVTKGTRESCSLLLFCCCYMYGFRKSFFIGLGFGGWWDGGYSLCNFFRLGGW